MAFPDRPDFFVGNEFAAARLFEPLTNGGTGFVVERSDAGKRAAYVGAGLVVFYMLITYGVFGVFANLALFVHIAFIFAGLVLLGSTLTLPGIAGIVLTIGMAVDSNVLIFERIREELELGKTVRNAVDLGFQRALSAIIDSNVTTIIAALFLFQFGTGPIKGFAVTLTLGLLISMFTAIFVSRAIFDAILSRRARVTIFAKFFNTSTSGVRRVRRTSSGSCEGRSS